MYLKLLFNITVVCLVNCLCWESHFWFLTRCLLFAGTLVQVISGYLKKVHVSLLWFLILSRFVSLFSILVLSSHCIGYPFFSLFIGSSRFLYFLSCAFSIISDIHVHFAILVCQSLSLLLMTSFLICITCLFCLSGVVLWGVTDCFDDLVYSFSLFSVALVFLSSFPIFFCYVYECLNLTLCSCVCV